MRLEWACTPQVPDTILGIILDMYRTLDPNRSKPGGNSSPFVQLSLGTNDETLHMAIRRQAKANKAFDAHHGRPSTPLFARPLGRGAGPYFAVTTHKDLAAAQGEAAITDPDRSAATLLFSLCRAEADTPRHLAVCAGLMEGARKEYSCLDKDPLACLIALLTQDHHPGLGGFRGEALLKARRKEIKKMRNALCSLLGKWIPSSLGRHLAPR